MNSGTAENSVLFRRHKVGTSILTLHLSLKLEQLRCVNTCESEILGHKQPSHSTVMHEIEQLSQAE
jgi:hypothetical protein